MTAGRSKPAVPQVEALPSVSPEQGIELLRRVHRKGEELLARGFDSDDYEQWETTTHGFLCKAFGSLSPNVKRVLDVGKYGSFPMGSNPQWWADHRARSLRRQLRMIDGLIEVLVVETDEPVTDEGLSRPASISRKVFVVHGHDKGAMHACARFLESLGLEPVILHEQADGGRTIIEKFVYYSSVGFAVVLLTADDRGGLASARHDKQQPRARQNVILELGYFLGKLGRRRVCALHTQGVEIPSDYSGVLFVMLDEDGGWRFKLARDLRGQASKLT